MILSNEQKVWNSAATRCWHGNLESQRISIFQTFADRLRDAEIFEPAETWPALTAVQQTWISRLAGCLAGPFASGSSFMKKYLSTLATSTQRVAGAAYGIAALSLLLAASASDAPADELTGIATLVVSDVQAGNGAANQALQSNMQIGADTVVATGTGSAVALAMADGTEIAIGADAEVTFADMVYDAASNVGKMTVEVSAGVIRFATGNLTKSSYEVRTPSAVTAVRGTIVTVYVAPRGSTYLAVEEGMTETVSRRGGYRFDVPLGAALFISTTGASDGALFSPLNGADLSRLPDGARPAAAVSEMDAALLTAASQSDSAGKTARALGLPYAIEKGVIKAEDLPAFASKTPAYTGSTTKSKDKKGGGY